MIYFLGVDAGNTKTVALVAHADGTVIGAGRSGCGDIYAMSRGLDIPSVEEAVAAALGAAGLSPSALVASGFNMAGADYAEDYAFIEAAVRRYGYGHTVRVVNDAIGPLWAGTLDGVGVAVNCGTGAATGARSAHGAIWHSSFWQTPTGGHELGRKTLKAVYDAELGIGQPTALSTGVLAFFGEPTVERVLHRLTARGNTHAGVVRHLARVLLDTAHGGDAVAEAIVQHHGAGLGALALVAARKVGIGSEPFTLVLTGGVLRHHTHVMADALVARVRAEAPAVRPVFSRFEPVVGALLLAIQSANMPIDEAVRDRLAQTLPSMAFFKSDE